MRGQSIIETIVHSWITLSCFSTGTSTSETTKRSYKSQRFKLNQSNQISLNQHRLDKDKKEQEAQMILCNVKTVSVKCVDTCCISFRFECPHIKGISPCVLAHFPCDLMNILLGALQNGRCLVSYNVSFYRGGRGNLK
jgi:hypothetical protein